MFDTKALHCLYKAMFQPILNYCIKVWGNTYKNNINQYVLYQKSYMNCLSFQAIVPYFSNVSLIKQFEDIQFNLMHAFLCTKFITN